MKIKITFCCGAEYPISEVNDNFKVPSKMAVAGYTIESRPKIFWENEEAHCYFCPCKKESNWEKKEIWVDNELVKKRFLILCKPNIEIIKK